MFWSGLGNIKTSLMYCLQMRSILFEIFNNNILKNIHVNIFMQIPLISLKLIFVTNNHIEYVKSAYIEDLFPISYNIALGILPVSEAKYFFPIWNLCLILQNLIPGKYVFDTSYKFIPNHKKKPVAPDVYCLSR